VPRREPKQLADIGELLDRLDAPIIEPDRGEREPAFVRGRGQDFCYATPVHPATGMDNDVTFLPT
jgi:hypothetical protein